MKRVGLLFFSLFIGKIAFALPGYWDTGYGQGIAEYTLENTEGRKVSISCNDGGPEDMDHSVYIYMKGHDGPIISEEEEYPPLEFLIDGDTYYAPYETQTRSGSNAWYQLTDALSKASSFKFFWNGEFFGDFESKNTSKTIANLKNCQAMADRDSGYEDDFNSAPSNSGDFNSSPMPQNPFKVTYEYLDPGGNGILAYQRVYVTSLDDSITVKQVVINRGNCSINRYLPQVPVRLGYSQSVYAVTSPVCDILEVKVMTNKGDVVYNF